MRCVPGCRGSVMSVGGGTMTNFHLSEARRMHLHDRRSGGVRCHPKLSGKTVRGTNGTLMRERHEQARCRLCTGPLSGGVRTGWSGTSKCRHSLMTQVLEPGRSRSRGRRWRGSPNM
ncbi:hypothetical protein SCOCK_580012 [Actinacidiphila cocklensis]|uniref:Uncharacterized protein n=1 Tax=Actinacidiphila cocklensis TaxID=887465 RepID=A0A9W4GUJ3_9ACTN|nr:hypothetical protein SCOCK_580012 [Actinacidiphila cocklensis]